MMYQVMMMNGGAVIAYNGTALFENLKLEVSLTRRVNFAIIKVIVSKRHARWRSHVWLLPKISPLPIMINVFMGVSR